MHTDVVHRTQIYLDDREVSALDAAAVRSGASRSELIRRAFRAQYGEQTQTSRLGALRTSAGAWTDREYTGSEFVDAIRATSMTGWTGSAPGEAPRHDHRHRPPPG